MPLGDLIKPTDKEGYDEETLKDMPAYPGLTLTSHVLLKNIQMLSVVGSIVGAGAWLRSSEKGFSSLFLRKCPRYAGFGGAAGLLTASAMMIFKMPSIDLEGLEDRAYRIVLNKKVQALDFYSAIGGVTSLLVGVSMRSRVGGPKIMSPWGLMAQGIAAGTVGCAIAAATGVPIFKPLELLGVRGFEPEEQVASNEG
ncbi:unnamed protein product [Ascophyllum nodosum]